MTLLLPDGRFDADVRRPFCHYVHLFASPATADRWIAQHPQTFWIPLDDAADLGRALAETVFTPH